MATLDSLHRRMQAIRRGLDKDLLPKTWHFQITEDEEIPASILAKVARQDQVIVREYPKGLLDLHRQGNWAYGYVTWGGERSGSAAIIWPDGTIERVK